MMNLEGKPAPLFSVSDTQGKVHCLEDYRGQWVMLVMHRHLAWLPCQEHLSQLRQHSDQFSRYQVACLVVTFETQQQAQRYVAEFALDWPMLVDVERTIYRAYDLEPRASIWNLLRPTFWPRYLGLMLGGRRVRKPTGDIYQLGGNVLIDPGGIVRLHRSSANPLDRPSPKQLLRVIQGSKNSSSVTE